MRQAQRIDVDAMDHNLNQRKSEEEGFDAALSVILQTLDPHQGPCDTSLSTGMMRLGTLVKFRRALFLLRWSFVALAPHWKRF